jgi:hypothetical protein
MYSEVKKTFCLTICTSYNQNITLHPCVIFTSRSGSCSLLQSLLSSVATALGVSFSGGCVPCCWHPWKHKEGNEGLVNRDLAMVGILHPLPGPPEFLACGWTSTRSRFLGGIFALKSLLTKYFEHHLTIFQMIFFHRNLIATELNSSNCS